MPRLHIALVAFALTVAIGAAASPAWHAGAEGGTPGPAGADQLGRFRAVFAGTGVPAEGGRCPALTVAIQGPGQASHLGRFTTAQSHCVDPTAADPSAFTDGRYTFTAADGSTIAGRYNGRLVPTETTGTDGLVLLDGRFTVEAGTGRFAGATGSGVADGLQNLTTGEASVVLDGTIAYPGPATAPSAGGMLVP
jgi:hypothetical protein